jgi:hypothetical protein
VDWIPVAQDTVQMWQSELTSHRVPGYRETRVHTTILAQVMRSAKYRRDLKVLHYVYSKRFRAAVNREERRKRLREAKTVYEL